MRRLYDLGTNKWQAGATWDGTVANKASTVKLWCSNKDSRATRAPCDTPHQQQSSKHSCFLLASC